MYIISYTGQNDKTMREIAKVHSQTLVCLDSGTSFRTKIHSGYIPSNVQLEITKRPENTEFRLIQGLEAEDIKSLWLFKKKIQEPTGNTRTQIKKILTGNLNKGVSPICPSEFIMDILHEIDPNWTIQHAIKWVTDNCPVDDKQIQLNYRLLSRDMSTYMVYLDNFSEIYQSL